MKLHRRGQKQHHKVLSSDPQHPQGYRLVSLLSGPTPLKATNRSRRLNVQWRSLRCIPLEKASQLTSQAQGQRTVARQHSRYWPTRRQDDYKEGDSCKEVNELWFQLHKSTCTVGLARWLRGSRHLPHKSDNLRQSSGTQVKWKASVISTEWPSGFHTFTMACIYPPPPHAPGTYNNNKVLKHTHYILWTAL